MHTPPTAAEAELIYNVDSSLVYKRLIAFQIRVGSLEQFVAPRVAAATFQPLR
jgi:hypothetical protein